MLENLQLDSFATMGRNCCFGNEEADPVEEIPSSASLCKDPLAPSVGQAQQGAF